VNTINPDSNISNYSSVVVGSAFDIRLTDRLPVPGVDFPASPEAPKIPPLGNNVNLQAISLNSGINPMTERYRLLALSKRILWGLVRPGHNLLGPGHNLLGCQRVPVLGRGGVSICRSNDSFVDAGYKSGFYFSGVKTCKSAWVCPVCSFSLAGARAAEVRQAIRFIKKSDGDVYMLTLTFRHSRFDDLGELLGRCKKALVKLWGQRTVKEMMKSHFIGRITATELTYSDGAGWHPHQHILLLGERGLSCEALQAVFGDYWIRALNASGLSGVSDFACNVQPASVVQDYLTKMSSELALGNTGTKEGKQPGHYSPFELLGMCRVRDDYKRLWREFYSVTRGRQCLAWSRGLKSICGVSERSDDEILDSSDGERFIPVITVFSEDWKELLTDYDFGFIRRAPSVDSIIEILDRRGARYRLVLEKFSLVV